MELIYRRPKFDVNSGVAVFWLRKKPEKYEDGNLETVGGLLKERQMPAFLLFETLK
jgi:hypothetical protein